MKFRTKNEFQRNAKNNTGVLLFKDLLAVFVPDLKEVSGPYDILKLHVCYFEQNWAKFEALVIKASLFNDVEI